MMQWKKRGLVFDPSRHTLAEGCATFAKSPQAVEMEDFVRVYFTSQKKTDNGKWISCPQFADFTNDFSTLLRTSNSQVISGGELGQFDEHGIFPFSVSRHEGRFLAYTSGWSRRKSVSIDMAIVLAESFDGGKSFIRYGRGGPIMSTTLNEPFMIADGFVRFYKGAFHMWYIYGTEWKIYEDGTEPERIYKISHAISEDGVNWKRNGMQIIKDVIPDECQALPSVLEIDGRYHMVFCYRAAKEFRKKRECAYRLGYASSDDLITWVRNDLTLNLERAPIDSGEWDSEMMCYPNLFKIKENIYLLYNGNNFGQNGFGLAQLNGF